VTAAFLTVEMIRQYYWINGEVMSILKRTNRFYYTRPNGYPQIRIYHKKGSEKKMPRYLLKCGCCDEKLEIYYDDEALESNDGSGGVKISNVKGKVVK
jgi:adenine specific DNA methylase Mod